MGKAKTPNTRETKVAAGFQELPPLKALNPIQADYIHAVNDTPIVVATGLPGTSKTYIPTRIGAKWLKQGAIKRIVIARPATSLSSSLGFFKGDHVEKMKMWIAPVWDTLKGEFPHGHLEYMLKEEIQAIDCVPVETIKGRSISDAMIIVDEAEDLTLHEIKSILTRVGTNCTLCLCGDIGQVDIGKSGLGELVQLLPNSEWLNKSITHISFDHYDDIVRSETVYNVVRGFDELGIL